VVRRVPTGSLRREPLVPAPWNLHRIDRWCYSRRRSKLWRHPGITVHFGDGSGDSRYSTGRHSVFGCLRRFDSLYPYQCSRRPRNCCEHVGRLSDDAEGQGRHGSWNSDRCFLCWRSSRMAFFRAARGANDGLRFDDRGSRIFRSGCCSAGVDFHCFEGRNRPRPDYGLHGIAARNDGTRPGIGYHVSLQFRNRSAGARYRHRTGRPGDFCVAAIGDAAGRRRNDRSCGRGQRQ